MSDVMNDRIITLDYGSGGMKTSELIESVFLPAFDNAYLRGLGDGAVLDIPDGAGRPVFSTDSFVVSPWRFPGGDIGKLAVCGTVNDVSMAGGVPAYLSLSLIIEEGFLFEDLKYVAASIASEAKKAGVAVVTGDTKVVERGKGDGIYINTAGIGFAAFDIQEKKSIRPGDSVILSGSPGRHGAAVMMARAGLLAENSALRSDCMPLDKMARSALEAGKGGIRILRDPTRGGAATTLSEFVEGTNLSIEIDENLIHVDPEVSAACAMLGLDPLYCACEGRMLAICDGDAAPDVIKAIRKIPGGEGAAEIGKVTESAPGKVFLKTAVGGSRILQKLAGMQLPRIC